VLDYPEKNFRLSWYVESNVFESDDPTPVGTPVADRITHAVDKQNSLKKYYDADRFANLFELNGSRDKKDGNLSGDGNRPSDWIKDAAAVESAGFALIAKSPTLAQVDELRGRFGKAFVRRIVFEDITATSGAANPGYRSEARALSERGETVTLVVHSGAYGGFPSTSLSAARAVALSDFPAPLTEMLWGTETAARGFKYVKMISAR